MRGPVHLNRKLVLEAADQQPDGAGGFSENWAPVGVLWADIRAGIGRERAVTGVTLATVAYRVIVRAAPHGAASRPMAGQRFRDGARLFRILAVSDGDRTARYLECFTSEEVLS